MNTEQQIDVLRIQLLKMAKLSQRAADYAIKAYEFAKPELGQHVLDAKSELRALEDRITIQGRALLAAGLSADSDLCFVRSSMRISGALRVTYTAAAEMAQNFMLDPRNGHAQYPALRDIGEFTNSQVRLYTVALFNEQLHHARQVLRNNVPRQRPGGSLYRTFKGLSEAATATGHLERSIVRSLGQIAQQAREIAQEIILWLECKNCIRVSRDRVLPDCRQIYRPPLIA